MIDENSNINIKQKKVFEHSKLIMASYGSRELFQNFITSAFGFTVFFYYEVVIGLNVILAALAFSIYSIWNAINDPLIVYIMEKFHTPWEKKYNLKRFPWLIIGVIPWLISYFMIYMVPLEWNLIKDPRYNLPVFGWFIVWLSIS